MIWRARCLQFPNRICKRFFVFDQIQNAEILVCLAPKLAVTFRFLRYLVLRAAFDFKVENLALEGGDAVGDNAFENPFMRLPVVKFLA